jgi:hypothetical protein
MTARTTPLGLDVAGKTLWKSITKTYELRHDEAVVLEQACGEADMIARLRDGMVGQPLILKGSQGQDVINPIVSELRQHRATQAALLRQLKLPDADAPGAVNQQRDAANAKHQASAWSIGGA